MKKIFLLLLITAFAFARTNAQVSFGPPTFTAIDPVTITVDVTGTPMAGETEAYIWIFSNASVSGNAAYPNKDGNVNGSWGNSSDAAKMTAAGTNKWKFTFTATELFGQTPAQLKDFGFLLKSKTGSKQSPDYKPYAFEPLIFTPTLFRNFPAKVGVEDVITVNLDKSLATDVNTSRMTPASVTVTFYNDGNPAVAVGTLNNVPVRNNGSIWSATFIPTQATIVLPGGTKLKSFKYKFNGTILDTDGKTSNVSTSETEVPFSDLK
ncbi:hypothetical protein OCK74_25960 [Chitinophagaceae bacterium LB-8]|uniref:Uncharacterized protein n=1 Tax=Paraflavisolibacter caeni TaxID=2982496 RepID=A0A9X3BAD5_9BACT|nr:hypothetical protein [Paraflavisolibacter caeni]MCU7552591.1 hypothetical protein [Paraflavisolibacter caeni]